MNGFADVNARIAKMAGAPVQMDPKAFTTYVAEQVQKSQKDPVDVQKARLAALEKASADAKEAFDKGGTTAPVTVFTEPAAAPVVAPAATTTVAAPAVVATGEPAAVAAPAAGATTATTLQGLVEKGQNFGVTCAVLAKALALETSTLRTELAKHETGKVTITKAASAVDTLRKVALAFGINPDDPRYADGCERIAWKVEEVVRCLENAAKAEQAVNSLAAAFGTPTEMAKSFTGLEGFFTRQAGAGESTSWPDNLNEGRGKTTAAAKG